MIVGVIAFAVILGPALGVMYLGIRSFVHNRQHWWPAAVAIMVGAAAWLIHVGLYPDTTLCDSFGRRDTCPTVFGTQPTSREEDVKGFWVLVGAAVGVGLGLGASQAARPETIGAGFVVVPTAIAWWTAPRGDNDGLWSFYYWYIALFGVLAIASAYATQQLARRLRR